MDAGGMEKDCSALGGLFQTIMSDMKGGYPVWEDFISKTTKLQSHLRTTIVIAGAFLDAFQKVADLATNTRGATKEIGSALTRMCMRHRSIESRLKQLTVALTESLINPLELRIEEWKKVGNQLDKDHAKECKKARQEIKKKSSDTLKLQKKVKKGKEDARLQLDSVLQDVNEKYVVLEDTEKQAVCRALIEERSRFCTFVALLRPVLGEEIGMLGEVTHLQTILEDLTALTADPQTLPPASEQVILDLKVTDDYNYTYHTPPSSPSGTLSRRGTVTSSSSGALLLSTVSRQPSITSTELPAPMDNIQRQPLPVPVSISHHGQAWTTLPPSDCGQASGAPLPTVGHNGAPGGCAYSAERPRAMTATATYKIPPFPALTLGSGAVGEMQRHSRDSLLCSSGYNTQTTTPSVSEDTIPTHPVKKETSLVVVDYDYISLHGEQDLTDQMNFDKSSTIPRNSDLSQNYRRMFQDKRPASTVSLLTELEPAMPSHIATIRRKPSSKPGRRGTVSGVPIPIRTPVVPVPVPGGHPVGRSGSEEWVVPQATRCGLAQGRRGLCSSAQSLCTIPSYVPQPVATGLNLIPTGNGLPAQPMGVTDPSPDPSPTEPGDVLSMIRRGVKLRKTVTDDRSAPKII
ncbi:protein MTSS 1 [Hypanus sabinus]|uniref:protein MTSS 1 n=1 Tax=Hypanus sabinus TaxID=79690 RepID=UPI0028C4EDFB|nr:protein MTSS 1 [Hypanus sabinus]